MKQNKRNSVTRTTEIPDAREFDLRVVRSVIDFANALQAPFHQDRNGRWDVDVQGLARPHFAWLEDELGNRASALGISEPKWEGDSNRELLTAWAIAMNLLGGHVGRGFPESRLRSEFFLTRVFTLQEFLDTALSPLPIHARYRYMEDRIERVELPLLTTIQRCVAYTIALVMENRWSLAGRIKECPFKRPGMHFFLDYRMDSSGAFLPGEQEYCCPAHSNAHRQQRHRERISTKVRKRK